MTVTDADVKAYREGVADFLEATGGPVTKDATVRAGLEAVQRAQKDAHWRREAIAAAQRGEKLTFLLTTEHARCDTCQSAQEQALTTAKVTGSIGATFEIRGTDGIVHIGRAQGQTMAQRRAELGD